MIRKNVLFVLTAIVVGLPPTVALADEAVVAEMTSDVVLRALVDELERDALGLHMEDLERPYFIEYALGDSTGAWVSAELGAVTGSDRDRSRLLRTDVRVGSYELDNTNFSGGRYGRFYRGGRFGGVSIPIEDDYNAIRQAIWWAADRDYKGVIETFEQKKAFMESKMIKDKPDDLSREEPTIYFEDRIEMSIDPAWMEETAVALSKIFRDYPAVQSSSVHIGEGSSNQYLVNTEGTRMRIANTYLILSVEATVQADDGMMLSDSLMVTVSKRADVPPLDELVKKCHEMARQLIALKDAPLLESYTGPVLFEREAAVAVFSGRFARRFAGGQRPVGSRTSPDDFANKLDKRILPRFFNVIDDPTLESIDGTAVLGHYKYDDQGVPARRVTLVEGGRLKTLLMSRNPSKEFANSTGHGRSMFYPRASTACLLVTAEGGLSPAALKEELLEACQDEDLDFGLRIASLGSAGDGRYGAGPGNPLLMYKVYPDGREELVRGAQIARIDLKAFKRMLAVGDKLYVKNSAAPFGGRTIAAPAMLFEELDLAKIDEDFDKPPILPTPLARGSQEAEE